MNKIFTKIFARKFIVKDITKDADPIILNLYNESINRLVKTKILLTINGSVAILQLIMIIVLIHKFLVK